jgi:hypothetical protein
MWFYVVWQIGTNISHEAVTFVVWVEVYVCAVNAEEQVPLKHWYLANKTTQHYIQEDNILNRWHWYKSLQCISQILKNISRTVFILASKDVEKHTVYAKIEWVEIVRDSAKLMILTGSKPCVR